MPRFQEAVATNTPGRIASNKLVPCIDHLFILVHDAAGIGVICAIEEQRLHARGRAGEEAEVRAASRKSGPERMVGASVDLMTHGSEE